MTTCPPSTSAKASDGTLYDLYGVVNHTGGLLGGHYTAYARTPHAGARDRNGLGSYLLFLEVIFFTLSMYWLAALCFQWLCVSASMHEPRTNIVSKISWAFVDRI